MSIQEKFEKAVNVIRNLPKNGSYQPSHELQLRFYAYYKQATEGINHHPKPSFWEVVKKAKYDAWHKLGNMTKEEAMIHYVDELRKIVETMSYNDNVANFLNSLDNFYEHVPAEDLELLVGPIIEKIRSRPNSPLSGSPLASRDTSPSRPSVLSRDPSPLRLNANPNVLNSPKHFTSSLETSPASSYSASPLPPDTDDEDEHFLDTQTEPDRVKDGGLKKSRAEDQLREPPASHGLQHPLTSGLQGKRSATDVSNNDVTLQVPEPVQTTISTIRKDLDQVKNRLCCIEVAVLNQPSYTIRETCNGGSAGDQECQTSLELTPTAAEAFKRAIENMTNEMDNLQKRMITMETRRKQEISLSRKRSGTVLPRWWGLSVPATTVLIAWPILILLISKWLASRRKR